MGLAAKLKAANPNGAALGPPPAVMSNPQVPGGAPPPAYSAPQGNLHPDQYNILHRHLQKLVADNGLSIFYPPERVEALARKMAVTDFTRISTAWRLNLEIAFDLSALALYDLVFYCDDSGSMSGAEQGTRIDDMKIILERVSEVATVFDDDGITVRFMNAPNAGDHIRNPYEVQNLLQGIPFKYTTPLGGELKNKILEPLVMKPLREGRFQKPVLVIVITDGEPYPEPRETVYNVIGEVKRELARCGYPPKSVVYQFAQCGRDQKAQEFLSELDSNAAIGDVIDSVSYYELEADEFMKKNNMELTPELYLVKLCVGAVDTSYDQQDEDASKTYAPPPGAPAGQFAPPPGQPPQGQYAPPPGQAPGQYHAPPPGAPPAGAPQYAPPPGGAPPPGATGQYAPPPGAPAGQYAPPPGQPVQTQYAPPGQAPGQYRPPPAGAPQYAPPPGQYAPPPGQPQYAPPGAPAPGQYRPPGAPQYAPPPGQYAPPPGGYAPPPGQYAPPQQGYAPPPQGYAPPPQQQYRPQPGYPGAQPGYPAAQPGYPAAQPGYPAAQAQPGYPAAQGSGGGFAQQASGLAQQAQAALKSGNLMGMFKKK
ncbi:hypothetical protein HDU97_004025 [Phlyctochytrium planicorne]|nr:hypothetical protein HDU97_004025 [Phlyctochytrium planicorne]